MTLVFGNTLKYITFLLVITVRAAEDLKLSMTKIENSVAGFSQLFSSNIYMTAAEYWQQGAISQRNRVRSRNNNGVEEF